MSKSVRRFSVITIHPSIVAAYERFGVLKSAREQAIATVEAIDLRDFAVDKHGSVDDRPYGGGEGMVMRPEPLAAALRSLPERPVVVLTSPAGKPWSQAEAMRWAADPRPMAVVCGRFAGVDERFIESFVDVQYSTGDYVLAGGELPALMMIESILRLLPGVLGDAESAQNDSFSPGFEGGLEHPLYTRPLTFEGKSVPEVLLSGDHARIARWRREESRRRTQLLRPDLLATRP